ncbi:prolipoprotein diacylglyceryl transferase [Nakamurella multipartita]|uniref:Phosphatidylglycerol--prolipoprotein diacylglyceryl transferase n=1 Tax=Nakamurella multipartita (strain ATCC 700099 / DSM 44233 / CIP 104796 / JCM 9543 / NBRC 105858 / Y-104) TaxID=479431 RepID=C8XBQ3_NAKMY|nr:prolipoprotein diacylglyceryl transferase [Nakamurella multipartita]ACV79407.1 prolipoprotein diacylglyceryl transferase [Nakamurella multipartita DSM 44233]
MISAAQLASIPSPSQGVWYVGPIALRAYAICIIVGIVVAVWIGNKRFVARGGRPGRVTDIAVFAVPFGIIGGRLYHVITDNQLYFGEGRNPWNAFAIWNGGLGIWGAIALGAVGAWIGCRHYKVPLASFADSVAPGIAVAQAIGRLGNYFNQELFGAPTTLPWGLDVFVRTPGGVPGVIPADGNCEFPTDYVKAAPEVLCGTYQPTFLYELLWCLGVAALVIWADKRFRLGGGRAFALYVAAYTLGRVWIEMLRIDPANHFFGLRINVFTSIVVFLGAVLFLYLRRHVTREDPALVWGPDRPGQRGRADEPGAPAGAPSGESADGPAAAPTAPADEPHPADKGPGTG